MYKICLKSSSLLFLVIASILLLVFFTACNGNGNEEEPPIISPVPISPTGSLSTISPPESQTIPVVQGKQAFDMTPYNQISLLPTSLEVSSIFQSFGVEALLSETSFWHVSNPRTSSSEWLQIDLGYPMQLAALAIKPRPDNPGQLWHNDGASLQVSPDGEAWTNMVRLKINNEDLNDTDWIAFILPADIGAHRYYRLFITSPEFISFSGIRFYVEGSAVPTPPATPEPTPEEPSLTVITGTQGTDILSAYEQIQLQASSLSVSNIFQSFGVEALLSETSFWHVIIPHASSSEWLQVDLGESLQLAALAIKPRPAYPEQLWRNDRAILQVSSDGEEWIDIVRLRLNNKDLNDTDWIAFILPADIGAHRYYRLFITSPEFTSFSGIRFYR